MFNFEDTLELDLTVDKVEEAPLLAQRCFFDLEGALTTAGDIVQLGAIITDWDFNILKVINLYFRNNKKIGAKELSIHQLDSEFLWANSTGHFCECLDEMPFNTDTPTMFISYTLFDVKRVNEELAAYGLPLAPFGDQVSSLASLPAENENCHFDLFKHGRKRGELLAKELGEEKINKIFEEIKAFGDFENKGNHDALFDCVMLLALCRGMVYGRH
jgi:hypothetical protein